MRRVSTERTNKKSNISADGRCVQFVFWKRWVWTAVWQQTQTEVVRYWQSGRNCIWNHRMCWMEKPVCIVMTCSISVVARSWRALINLVYLIQCALLCHYFYIFFIYFTCSTAPSGLAFCPFDFSLLVCSSGISTSVCIIWASRYIFILCSQTAGYPYHFQYLMSWDLCSTRHYFINNLPFCSISSFHYTGSSDTIFTVTSWSNNECFHWINEIGKWGVFFMKYSQFSIHTFFNSCILQVSKTLLQSPWYLQMNCNPNECSILSQSIFIRLIYIF